MRRKARARGTEPRSGEPRAVASETDSFLLLREGQEESELCPQLLSCCKVTAKVNGKAPARPSAQVLGTFFIFISF